MRYGYTLRAYKRGRELDQGFVRAQPDFDLFCCYRCRRHCRILSPTFADTSGALITPSIAVLMYAMFLQIPFLSLRAAVANRRFLGALLLSNFVFIPILAWALTLGLSEHRAIMVGALLVLLTPCIDYVVVFTHLGKGDSKLVLSATPILLLLQFAFLPVYLVLILSGDPGVAISVAPFVEAFLALIVAPLLLAVLTEVLSSKSRTVRSWTDAWAWLPVPAMAAVLIVVIGSQISTVVTDAGMLALVVPVYIAFLVLAPALGALAARLCRLASPAARPWCLVLQLGTRLWCFRSLWRCPKIFAASLLLPSLRRQ